MSYDANKGCPAAVKLMGHVLQKGFEAGGIIGGLLVAPGTVAYQTLYKKQQSVDILEVAQNAAISCAAGVGLSALLGSIKILQMDKVGLEERVFRLHYNESQKRNDTFAVIGAAVGLGAAAYFLQSDSRAKPVHYLGCAGVGAAGGVLLHLVSRPQAHKTPNKMVHELLH